MSSTFDWTDTIAAPATPVGDGARSIVRISGGSAFAIASQILDLSADGIPPLPWTTRMLFPANLRLNDWGRTVLAWVYVWPEGGSQTGQALCEFHIVCSPSIISSVLEQLLAHGARLARRGEFLMRAFLAGRIDLAQAEAVHNLIEADDVETLRAAIDQRVGGVSREVATIRSELLDFLADIEAGLDFAEEDIEFVRSEEIRQRLESALESIEGIQSKVRSRGIETARARVVLVGPANAGKSSLFNAIVGSARAIAHEVAGTTRDSVSAVLELEGSPIEFVDTAGFDVSADALWRAVEDVRGRELGQADLVLECSPTSEVGQICETEVPKMSVRTKRDLATDFEDRTADVSVSIFDRASVERLLSAVLARLDTVWHGADGRISATVRVAESLGNAARAMRETLEMHREAAGEEFVAGGIREAVDHLGQILGAVYTEDLLDRVFSRFCIGK